MRINHRFKWILITIVFINILLISEVRTQTGNEEMSLINSEMRILLGRYGDALQTLEQVRTSRLWAHYLRGVANRYQGNTEAAIQEFRSAISFQDDEKSMLALSYLSLGQLLLETGQYQEAVSILTHVINRFYGNLALNHPRCKDYDYLDNAQSGILVIADDAQFMIAQIDEQLGDRASAQIAYAKIQRFYPFSTRSAEAGVKMDDYLK